MANLNVGNDETLADVKFFRTGFTFAKTLKAGQSQSGLVRVKVIFNSENFILKFSCIQKVIKYSEFGFLLKTLKITKSIV